MKRFLLVAALAAALALAQAPPHFVVLTWTDPSNPTGTTYTAYRAPGLLTDTLTFTKLSSAIAALTYSDTPVPPGNYVYHVTAVLNGVESAPSANVAAVVPPFPPQALQIQIK